MLRLFIVAFWTTLLYLAYRFNFLHIRSVEQWSPAMFWVLWVAEGIFMLWWTFSEMRLQYLSMNPNVLLGWLWLVVALVLMVAKLPIAALVMVGITALPLLLMGLYLLVILIASLFGPIRWN